MKQIAAVLLPFTLLAQAPPRLAPGADSIKASDLRADLTFLASDALEGRMSLERGSEVAIQWIAAEFGKAGLKPLVDGTYLQPVPLVEYRGDRQLSGLTLKINGKTETLQATGSYPNDGNYSGKVVFAGFGITAPELGYDDYASIDAHGKVVLVFNHEPQEDDAKSIFNGKGNTRYANARAKMFNAARHGAVAVLVMPDPNHPKGMVRGPLDNPQARQQAPRTPRPIQAIADEESIPVFNITAAAGEKLLRNGSLSITPSNTPETIQASIDATLKPASKPLDAEATLHVVNAQRKRQLSYNVVGLLEGSDPTLSAETIIISAHYDHDGLAAGGGIYHGADDNGSGTVGVVALAKAFMKNPTKPKRSILFAVYAAEERGLLGAYYYAAHPLRPLETTRAVINFDMIGRNEAPSTQTNGLMEIAPDTSNELNIIGTKYSPDYRAAVVKSNEYAGLHLSYKWDEDTVLSVLFRSDQYPFLMHDIPAMWWFTGFHPDYHQTTDTADKINYVKMEKILKLAYLTAFDFADAKNPPKFVRRPAL